MESVAINDLIITDSESAVPIPNVLPEGTLSEQGAKGEIVIILKIF